jgi:hypothetical protein
MRTKAVVAERDRIAALPCMDKGCHGGGRLDPDTVIINGMGSNAICMAYACSACGRLHWATGSPASGPNGGTLFLVRGSYARRVEERN